MTMKLDEMGDKYKEEASNKAATKAEFTIPLLHFKQFSERLKELRTLRFIPSRIEGLNDVLGGGYPHSSILNVVGFPKAGKTTLVLHEILLATNNGKESFVMFNESPPDRYFEVVDRHRVDLGIPESKLDAITFANAHERDLKSANYDYIDKMASIWIRQPIEAYLKAGHKPEFFVFDSLTKFYRTWAAQSFRFVQATVFHLHDLFKTYNVHPITFVIHQKASGEWAKDDARGFGGWGNIHEVDGSLVLSFIDVDTWFARDTGFPVGTRQRFIRADSRYVKTDEMEHHFIQVINGDGRKYLKVGRPLPDIIYERKMQKLQEDAQEGDSENGSQ